MNNLTIFWQFADRARRFIFTALLYVAFGIGALTIAILVVLPIVTFSRNRENRVKQVRNLNRLAFKSFIRSGTVLGVFDASFSYADRLNAPGQLVIANHPSLLDVVFLLGSISNANCVVKRKLLRNPFLAIQVYFADYILNDGGETLLDKCVASLDNGETVIIFPEGTRTTRDQGHKFQRGVAYLILMTRCPVRPVYISCWPKALGKKDAWYIIPEEKITYRFAVLEELNLSTIRGESELKPPLKARRLIRRLVEWYNSMDLQGPYDICENIDFNN